MGKGASLGELPSQSCKKEGPIYKALRESISLSLSQSHVEGKAQGTLFLSLPFEVASICRKKLERHGEQRHLILTALEIFARMAIERIEIHLPGIVSLAEQTQLTTYDASYLWLARQAEAELITLDQKLAVVTLDFGSLG